MNPTPRTFHPSSNQSANDHYARGAALKAQGQHDIALTEFRRAAILDPAFFSAQLEIGFLCRDRARLDPMFRRYAYDAFQRAAQLDLTDAEAHDQYILAGQEMGLLDTIHAQYDDWAKKNPENTNLQRCNKNIIALSMALIPDRVNVSRGTGIIATRRFVLLFSIGGALMGLALAFGAPILVKTGQISVTLQSPLIKTGIVLFIVGALGLAGASFLR